MTSNSAGAGRFSRREWLFAAQAAVVTRRLPSETHLWTLCEAAEQIRRKKISSEELTKQCLARIAQRDRRLNAFITVTADLAIEQARQCDKDLQRSVLRGRLHGVPIALKDNIDTAGTLTTAASKIYEKRIPAEDAEVARRISKAGAVLLGKLNLDEFAFAGSGTTGSFGPVHNPWNLDRITGGSSAGSAAALADYLCYGSVGSDDGGSVRIPGSHCGVVGFKPSFGRASTRGIVPSAYSLDCAGPLARNVEDAAVLLEVIAGNDPLDAITLDRPVPAYSRSVGASISHLRIGVPRTVYFENLDEDVNTRVEEAISLIRPKVAEVREVKLPQFQMVQGGGTDIELYHYHKQFFDATPELYSTYSQRLLDRAKNVSAVAYVETLKRIREARRNVRQVFTEVDVLLLPTMREPAPAIKEVMERTHRSRPGNTSAFNRFGLPAMTVPCGLSRNGLPIGLQIVGPYFGEPVVVAVASGYERLGNFSTHTPPGA